MIPFKPPLATNKVDVNRIGEELMEPPVNHFNVNVDYSASASANMSVSEDSMNSSRMMMLSDSTDSIMGSAAGSGASSGSGLIPVTSQPQINIMNKSGFMEKTRAPTGLAWVALADTILIELNPSHCNCDWDMKYNISDDRVSGRVLMFQALEELQCCSFGSLQNIVIRDKEEIPIARVCYKEKSCLSGRLAIGIYSPPDLLLGSGEEFQHFGFLNSPRFQLRNSEGERVFIVEYKKYLWPGTNQFSISSLDGNTDMAQILSKSENSIRLHFSTKLSITLKMILLGFSIAILHKSYSQPFLMDSPSPPSAADEAESKESSKS